MPLPSEPPHATTRPDGPAGSRTPWPRAWPLLLPASYAVHLVEEFWTDPGLVAWGAEHLSETFTASRALLLNGIALPLMIVLCAVATLRPALSWLALPIASLQLLNGLVHALGSAWTATYCPGLVTGALLYVPLGVQTLRWGRRTTTAAGFQAAVAAGILIHGIVAIFAFLVP